MGALLFLGVLALLIFFLFRKPSNQRNWSSDQEILPSISTYGDLVTLHNVRNARYKSTDDYKLQYYNKTFRVSELEKVWLVKEPFGPHLPFKLRAAHVLVSFELSDSSFFSISVEIRKKKGDRFSSIGALKGLFRQFELMYVIADERDVIQLRTNYRKDDVYLYPLRITKETVRDIFSAFQNEVNDLIEHPSFFHTALHNCTTVLIRNLRRNGIALPSWNISYAFPNNIDTLLFSHNVIDTTLSLEEARAHFYITEKAQAADGAEDFSKRIRI